LPARRRFSHLAALWTSDLGDLNQAYQLWAYDDLNHRAAARARALDDPDWKSFQRETASMVVRRQAMIWMPDACSPLR
jgi:hypothetical protein